MASFTIPDFIKNKDVDTIHQQMCGNLPKDIDVSEGSHPFNLTYPTAYEHAYFAQYCLLCAIKLIWPEYSYGVYSDYHGEMRNMERRAAQYSTGYVEVTGKAGTEIPEGTIFSTEQVDDSNAIEFETTGAAEIESDNEAVTIPIAAVEAGKNSNVAADTIIVNTDKISGISSVTNPEATSGGYDEEDDDSFNERMKEYDQSQDNSFIGNDNDYRRWALSVDGVGEAVIIDPEDNSSVDDDSGIVTIIITDSNGDPGSTALCADVYNYIMSPTPLSTTGQKTEGETTSIERLAPPGVILIVAAPDTNTITVSATVELDGTSDLDTVKTLYLSALQEYFTEAISDGEIRYSKVGSCLSEIDGVADYTDLLLNGGTTNVQFDAQEVPSIASEDITLTEGTVD